MTNQPLVFAVHPSLEKPAKRVVLEDNSVCLEASEIEFLNNYQTLLETNTHSVLTKQELDLLDQKIQEANKTEAKWAMASIFTFLIAFVASGFAMNVSVWLGVCLFTIGLGCSFWMGMKKSTFWFRQKSKLRGERLAGLPLEKDQEEEVSLLLYELTQQESIHPKMKEVFLDLTNKMDNKTANNAFVHKAIELLKELQKSYHLKKARNCVRQKLY